MKAKYALIALLAITFFGCDDNTAGLGLGMFPGSDQNINGKLTTFDVTTQSISVGDVYAKTNIGYVGKFTDETFGTYQAGFLAQLNCPEGMTFPEAFDGDYKSGKGKMITDFNDVEESVRKNYTIIKDNQGKGIGNCQINIYLWYDSYFGDSLTACRLSMYELNKKGEKGYWYKDDKAYYTDIDPEKYYDKEQSLLGRKSYTAVDLSVSDSIRNLSTYTPNIKITLDKEKTEELGRELLMNGRTKDLYKEFQNIFPGLYVESDYGDGTILYINAIQMDVAFLEHARDSITGAKLHTYTGKDSVIYAGRSFTSTREVIQANKLKNDKEVIEKRIQDKDHTYLKSPAGIFTELTLPIEDISNALGNDTLNAVKLSIPIYNEATNNKKFGMSVPKSVLLIRKKYKDDFFKNNELSDGIKSSLFDYSSSATSLTAYTFNNITQMVNDCLADKDRGEDWNKFVLIPVLVTKDDSSNSYYGTSSNVISIQHDLKPSYARLKGGIKATDTSISKEEQDKYKLKLEVVSTSFKP